MAPLVRHKRPGAVHLGDLVGGGVITWGSCTTRCMLPRPPKRYSVSFHCPRAVARRGAPCSGVVRRQRAPGAGDSAQEPEQVSAEGLREAHLAGSGRACLPGPGRVPLCGAECALRWGGPLPASIIRHSSIPGPTTATDPLPGLECIACTVILLVVPDCNTSGPKDGVTISMAELPQDHILGGQPHPSTSSPNALCAQAAEARAHPHGYHDAPQHASPGSPGSAPVTAGISLHRGDPLSRALCVPGAALHVVKPLCSGGQCTCREIGACLCGPSCPCTHCATHAGASR